MCRQDSRCIRDFLPEPANRVPLVVREAGRVLGAEQVGAPDAGEEHRDVDFAEVPDGGKLSATQVVWRVLVVGGDALAAAGALPLARRSRVGGAYYDHPGGAGRRGEMVGAGRQRTLPRLPGIACLRRPDDVAEVSGKAARRGPGASSGSRGSGPGR